MVSEDAPEWHDSATGRKVLILVLVEDGLGESSVMAILHGVLGVLILVLVEDGLGGI